MPRLVALIMAIGAAVWKSPPRSSSFFTYLLRGLFLKLLIFGGDLFIRNDMTGSVPMLGSVSG